jgi:hypothetical protein
VPKRNPVDWWYPAPGFSVLSPYPTFRNCRFVPLFALVTGFEITMAESIRRKFAVDEDWMAYLSEGRRAAIKTEIAKSKRDDGFVDALLFTQFCDKADIIRKSIQFAQSKTTVREHLTEIQKLRDNLAHANEFAASPAEAKRVCRVVRSLLALKNEIACAGRRGEPQRSVASQRHLGVA